MEPCVVWAISGSKPWDRNGSSNSLSGAVVGHPVGGEQTTPLQVGDEPGGACPRPASPAREAHLFRHHPRRSFWVGRALLEAGAELRPGASPWYCMLAPISTLSVSDGPSLRWHGRVAAGIAGDAGCASRRSHIPRPEAGCGVWDAGVASDHPHSIKAPARAPVLAFVVNSPIQ